MPNLMRVSLLRFMRFFFLFAAGLPLIARAGESAFAIVTDDGSLIPNHRVPVQIERQTETLPGVIIVGNPRGRVSITEFYDVNCPFCRAASPHIEAMLRKNHELRIVLVPFPVLGVASIQATRVELAVAQLVSPQKFYQFHRLLDGLRGTIDGARALNAAKSIGLDQSKLVPLANEDRIAEVMKQHVQLGDALGIQATPGIIIQGVAIVGYPGPKALEGVIAAVERCGEVVCGAH